MVQQLAARRPFGHGPPEDSLNPAILKPSSGRIASSETTILRQPPSCIEFYRNDSRCFVIGTYKLLDNKTEDTTSEDERSPRSSQKRVGSIVLCRLDPTFSKIQEQKVIRLQHAVFDLHFHPKYHDLLGVATSSTKVSFFKFRTAPLSLQYLFSVPVNSDKSALATFFSWSPFPTPGPAISFTVTFSTGAINRFENIRLRPARGTKREAKPIPLTSHSLEAWYATYIISLIDRPPNMQVVRRILTGGDDAALIAHEMPLSSPTSPATLPPPPPSSIFTDKRIHTAGVTAILPLPSLRTHLGNIVGDLILTGSYDETIRLISISSSPPFPRKVLASLNLGGGVWRIKLLSDIWRNKPDQPETKNKLEFLVLASCMHAGPQVLRITCLFGPTTAAASSPAVGKSESKSHSQSAKQQQEDNKSEGEQYEWNIERVTKFEDHESMNYASDWTVHYPDSQESQDGKGVVVVSTSFYDARVCIWRPFLGVEGGT